MLQFFIMGFYEKEYMILKQPASAYRKCKISPESGVFDGTEKLVRPKSSGFDQKMNQFKIYFINGIQNSIVEAYSSASNVADILGAPVHLIYSQEESFLKDLWVAAIDIGILNQVTCAGQNLRSHIKKDLNIGKKVLVLAHSRGAAITTKLVESMHLDEEITKNLTVATFGGFCKRAERWNTNANVISFINADSQREIADTVPLLGNFRDQINIEGYGLAFYALSDMHSFNGAYIDDVARLKKLLLQNYKGKKTFTSPYDSRTPFENIHRALKRYYYHIEQQIEWEIRTKHLY